MRSHAAYNEQACRRLPRPIASATLCPASGRAGSAMLNFSDVAIRRGTRLLFSAATFGLFRGEKVGITGENGSGKSSLLALVRGELQPDAGSFDMPSNLEIAHVSQELHASDQQAIEFVLDGDAELRAIERQIADAEARDDGHKLGELYATYASVG